VVDLDLKLVIAVLLVRDLSIT